MQYTRKYSKGGSRHTRRVRKSRVTRRRRNQKGGMLAGALSALRQAVLPYLMFKAQKRVQRRRNVKKGTMKRRSRK